MPFAACVNIFGQELSVLLLMAAFPLLAVVFAREFALTDSNQQTILWGYF